MPIYMKIPDQNGSVTTKNYRGCIELNSFEVNFGRPTRIVSAGSTQDRTVGGCSFSKLSIHKPIDKSSGFLYVNCAKGKLIPEISIYVVKTEQSTERQLLEYTLKNVLVASVEKIGSPIYPGEILTLSFTYFQERFTPFDFSNKVLGPSTVAYNITDGTVE